MAGFDGDATRAAALGVGAEDLLLRAALLSGHGPESPVLAARLAGLCGPAGGRSCVEAGAPVQITVSAPGPAGLRVGVRMARFDGSTIHELTSASAVEGFEQFRSRLPTARHESFGHWLFWNRNEQSMLIDLRDPKPSEAWVRLKQVLDAEQTRRLEALRQPLAAARPWAVEHVFRGNEPGFLRLYWLLGRHALAEPTIEALQPGAWSQVVDVLSELVRRPGRSGRWLISTPLDHEGALRIGNSGWTLAPEDEQKHRAAGSVIGRFGGERDYAEAMWSLCRGLASPDWRVGRTCEIEPDQSATRVRLHLTPEVQAITARINNVAEDDSSISPTEAAPASE